MEWKWQVLLVLTCALFAIAGSSPNGSGSNSRRGWGGTADNERPAVYIARVLSVSAAGRDAFVSCLRRKEFPAWQKLKRGGLLTDQSVFETSSVRLTAPGVPAWNFLLLSHLAPAVAPDAFFNAEEKRVGKRSPGTRCEDAPGVETRRIEVLHSTPNSYHPRPAARTHRRNSLSHTSSSTSRCGRRRRR